jgi:predicted DNA-binding transcriptional regulator YafY
VRNQALERTLRLLRLLQRGARTLDRLAQELNVTTRTIRRDLEVLSVAGFQVTSRRVDYGDARLWYVAPGDGSCPVCLTERGRRDAVS